MSTENELGFWGGIITLIGGGVASVVTFFKWYGPYRDRRAEKEHKHKLEKEAAEYQRETERTSGQRSFENTVIRRWKAIAETLEKQNQQLIVDVTKKQDLLDLFVRREQHCREAFARYNEWSRAVNLYLRQTNSEWNLEPPDVTLDDFDFDFQVRSSAQETTVLKAMAQEAPKITPSMKEMPAVGAPPSNKVDHERPGG